MRQWVAMEPGVYGISALHERLREVAGGKTYRALADMTGQNAETVRRYMCGQPPSVEFLSAMCVAHGVSADWLLTGQGPMRAPDARRGALSEGNAGDVLSAVASALETLRARLDRIEVFVQTLEARVRAGQESAERGTAGVDGEEREQTGGDRERATKAGSGAGRAGERDETADKAAFIAGGIARRSRPHAG